MRLVREDALLGGAGAAAFLTAEFFPLRLFRGAVFLQMGGDLFEQQFFGEEPVLALVARGLTFDLQSRRPVDEHDAGGGFVDVLPAVSAGTDKGFLEVSFTDAQGRHALGKLVIVSGGYRDRTHGRRVAGRALVSWGNAGRKKLPAQSSKLKGITKHQEPSLGRRCEFCDSAIDLGDAAPVRRAPS